MHPARPGRVVYPGAPCPVRAPAEAKAAGGAAGGDNDPRVLAAKALLAQAGEDDGDLAVAEAALAVAHFARDLTSAIKGSRSDPRFKAVKELFDLARKGDGDLTKSNAAFLALELTIHQEKAVMQAKLRKDKADRNAVLFAAKTTAKIAKLAACNLAWEARLALSQGR